MLAPTLKYAVVQWPGDGHHAIHDVVPYLQKNKRNLAGRIVVLPELINRTWDKARQWLDVTTGMDVALQNWCRSAGCVVVTSLHRQEANWAVCIDAQNIGWMYPKVEDDTLGACKFLGSVGNRVHEFKISSQRHMVYVCMDYAFAQADHLSGTDSVVITPSNMGESRFGGGGMSVTLPSYLRGVDVLLANRFSGGCRSFIALRDGTVIGSSDSVSPAILYHPPLTTG